MRLLQGSYPDKIHVLRETHVDVDVETIGGNTSRLRVIGSPVTPLIPLTDQQFTPGQIPCASGHNGIRPDDHAEALERWDSLLKRADCDRGVIMVAHGPPYGILDLVQRERRCGCDAFAQALSQHKAPSLCVFGHVHAQQSDEERGPRLVRLAAPPWNVVRERGVGEGHSGHNRIPFDGGNREVRRRDDAAPADGPGHTGSRLQGGPRPARRPEAKYWRDPNDPEPAEPVRWVRPKRRAYPGARRVEEDSPAKRRARRRK